MSLRPTMGVGATIVQVMLVMATLSSRVLAVDAQSPGPSASSVAEGPGLANAPAAAELPEVVVEAPEPRYVSPTRRDRIGRIWAPVLINDRGPFRLVLDTGASHSAVTPRVVNALGIDPAQFRAVHLHGVTGQKDVPAINVDSFVVGDLELRPARLPILADVFGGAEGVLGNDGLRDKRIVIDFRHDAIRISRSHNERAPAGFITVPVRIVGGLIIVDGARFGDIPVEAVIDTGGQATLANAALGEALRRRARGAPRETDIIGATQDVETAERVPTPPLHLGALSITTTEISVGDLYIFQHWHMIAHPALLIGMDVLGRVSALIIDYRRRELQVLLPT